MKNSVFFLVFNLILSFNVFFNESSAYAKKDPVLIYGCGEIDPILTDSGYGVMIESKEDPKLNSIYTLVLFQQTVFGIQEINAFSVTLERTKSPDAVRDNLPSDFRDRFQDTFKGDGISIVISPPKKPGSDEYSAQLSLNLKTISPLDRELVCKKVEPSSPPSP